MAFLQAAQGPEMEERQQEGLALGTTASTCLCGGTGGRSALPPALDT